MLTKNFNRYYHSGNNHSCEYEILHCHPKPQGNYIYRHIFKIYKLNGNKYDFHCYVDVFMSSCSKKEALENLDTHFENYLKIYQGKGDEF